MEKKNLAFKKLIWSVVSDKEINLQLELKKMNIVGILKVDFIDILFLQLTKCYKFMIEFRFLLRWNNCRLMEKWKGEPWKIWIPLTFHF